MTGHAGSTPAHPVCVSLFRSLRSSFPDVLTVYGGVYPTYHAEAILAQEPAIDVVVRGEGEATAVELAGALQSGCPPAQVAGSLAPLVDQLAYCDSDGGASTAPVLDDPEQVSASTGFTELATLPPTTYGKRP